MYALEHTSPKKRCHIYAAEFEVATRKKDEEVARLLLLAASWTVMAMRTLLISPPYHSCTYYSHAFFETDRPRLTRLPSRAHIQVGKKSEGDNLDASFKGRWLLGPEPILSYDEDALTIDFIDGAEVTVRPLMMGYYDIIVDDTSLYHCYYTAEAKGILINVIADDEGGGIAPSPASTCLSKGVKKSPRPALPTHERVMEDKDWVLL